MTVFKYFLLKFLFFLTAGNMHAKKENKIRNMRNRIYHGDPGQNKFCK